MSRIPGNPNIRKSILILVDWFIPGYQAGGPIQSCANVAYALQDSYNIRVLTTDTDYGAKEPYPEIIPDQWSNQFGSGFYVYYAQKKTLSFRQIKCVLLESNADYIYLNHMFSPKFVIYPLWLKWRSVVKSRIALCPRGALFESALSIKKYKKRPFLKLFKWMGIHRLVRFHATNESEKNAILKYFPGSEIIIADNLPNMVQPVFLDIYKEPGMLKCIFVARIHPIKNLLFLLLVLQKVKAKVELTIIGLLEDEGYWRKCEAIIHALPKNIVVNYRGPVPNSLLFHILQEHHLFVLPTTGENFGHAIFESFLAGRPVLISDQTPWRQLNISGLGWDLPLAKMSDFTDIIESAALWDQQTFSNYAKNAWNFAKTFINNPALKMQYSILFDE